jgi:uncharacterized protein YjbI with pentapeptide repeats
VGRLNLDFLLGALVSFGAAVLGGLTWVGLVYVFQGLRVRRDNRQTWYQTALEWATVGQKKESLRRADLHGQDLQGVNLAGADLGFAKLRKTNLCYAWLSESYLRGVDLHRAQLDGARITDAQLAQVESYEGAALADGGRSRPIVCRESRRI